MSASVSRGSRVYPLAPRPGNLREVAEKAVGVLGGHLEGGDTDDVSYSVVLGHEGATLYRAAGGE